MKTDILATVEFLAGQYSTDKNRVDLDDAQLEFWLEALADYQPTTLRKAAVACVKTLKWMPKLSEFLDLCEHNTEEDDRRQTWAQAMDLYNAALRGVITDEQLERDPAYQWLMRSQRPREDDNEIWERSCAEVTLWMNS